MDGQELAGIRLFGATIPIQTPDHASRSENESNVHNDHHEEDQEEVGINKLLAADLDHDIHDNQEQEQEHQDQEQRTEESTNRGAAAEKPIQCPRCKSVETKFCYFNNYNVNQPRHFCKGCQRYWTAGGALRNVPVGAGRRKINKPPSSLEEEEVEVEEDWQITAPGLPQVFPVKRRRSTSAGQSC